MRRFTLASVALVLVAGLVAVAAPTLADPYPASVPTACQAKFVKHAFHRGEKPRARFRVQENSNGAPQGKIEIFFREKTQRSHAQGKFVRSDSRSETRGYDGDFVRTWKFRSFRPGRYAMRARFVPRPKSRFRDCQATISMRVRNH